MVHCKQLSVKIPECGNHLWGSSPIRRDKHVQVGDVGFIRKGRFYRLFNALLSADDPSHELGVPDYHERLVPNLRDHIGKTSLRLNHHCSPTDRDFRASGPEDFGVSLTYSMKRTGTVLSLPVKVRREDTLAQSDFGEWMLKNVERWFVFARRLGLGIEYMEEIILVTGCGRTRAWTSLAFSGGMVDARVTLGVKVVDGLDASTDFRSSPEHEHVRGVVLHQGPEEKSQPENQCVFIRGFRVACPRRIWPKHLEADARASRDSEGYYDREPDWELVSTPVATKLKNSVRLSSDISNTRDRLHLLLDYIAERTPDCDMILVHDDDLERIDGIGGGISLQTLRPGVVMDLLRRSHIEIHKVWCDLSSPSHSPNIDTDVVRVAMLSMIFQNWTQAVQDTSLRHSSESSVSSSESSSVPSIRISQGSLGGERESDTKPPYTQGGDTHETSHGDTYIPTLPSPRLQEGMAPITPLRQPPMRRVPRPAFLQPILVQSANLSHPPSPGDDFGHQQNLEPMITAGSQFQDPLGVYNVVGGPFLRVTAGIASLPESPPTPEWPTEDSPSLKSPDFSDECDWSPQIPVTQRFSRCTGKRKALIVGIDYTSHSDPYFRLRCCAEDAYNMGDFLCDSLNFEHENVRIITDKNLQDFPTRENILGAMRALVHDAQPHDSLFFYFSGHGMQVKDMDEDEDDGLDECICAVDYSGGAAPYLDDEHTPGIITDDVMHDLMVKPLPWQCRLTAIFDSCHSGTVLDLPYTYSSKGAVKKFRHPNSAKILRQKASHADVVSLSACKDNQKANETVRGGALRLAFVDCLNASQHSITYKGLIKTLREHMQRDGFAQKPLLSSSHAIDTDLVFIV